MNPTTPRFSAHAARGAAPLAAFTLLALLIATALAMPSLSTPPAAHAQQTPVSVWSTTMTAGVAANLASGFNKDPALGSLADATFTHDGTNHEVTAISSFGGLTPIHRKDECWGGLKG